jgi:glycosyltransferase involved in cell wall biosynthesis
MRKKIVIDAYSPFYLEHLEVHRDDRKRSALMQKIDALRIKFLFSIADYILCASGRQKELWLEWLRKIKREGTPIAIVPTGVREEPPVQKRRIFKGVIPGIKDDNKVVLWSSGIWPWLDPISAIKAMGLIKDEKIKLVFFGLKVVDSMLTGNEQPQLAEAVRRSKELGLFGKRVFFVYDRMPYDEIGDYLLDADIALNLHFDHLETRYAFRGRVLDYIWAGLPLVTTKGDVLAEEVAGRKMGIVVDYTDEKQIADAISKLVNDRAFYEQCRRNMKQYAGSLHWSRVAEPLSQYCAAASNRQANKKLSALAFLLRTMVKFYLLSGLYLFPHQKFWCGNLLWYKREKKRPLQRL